MGNCNHCNEVKTMTYQDMPAVRDANGSRFIIKGVPVEKCGCDEDGLISFRVGLEMDYYAANDKSTAPEVEYSVIAELVSGLSNLQMIDPEGRLGTVE